MTSHWTSHQDLYHKKRSSQKLLTIELGRNQLITSICLNHKQLYLVEQNKTVGLNHFKDMSILLRYMYSILPQEMIGDCIYRNLSQMLQLKVLIPLQKFFYDQYLVLIVIQCQQHKLLYLAKYKGYCGFAMNTNIRSTCTCICTGYIRHSWSTCTCSQILWVFWGQLQL